MMRTTKRGIIIEFDVRAWFTSGSDANPARLCDWFRTSAPNLVLSFIRMALVHPSVTTKWPKRIRFEKGYS
jgi:hypothetical protein